MTMLRIYASMLGTLGSLFLVWLRDPHFPRQLYRMISPYIPSFLALPGLTPLRLVSEAIPNVSHALGHVASEAALGLSQGIYEFSKIVSNVVLPTVNWSMATLVGGLLHLLVSYLSSSLQLPPKIHLMGKLVPVVFWYTVGWFLSSSWGLNKLSLAPLTYIMGKPSSQFLGALAGFLWNALISVANSSAESLFAVLALGWSSWSFLRATKCALASTSNKVSNKSTAQSTVNLTLVATPPADVHTQLLNALTELRLCSSLGPAAAPPSQAQQDVDLLDLLDCKSKSWVCSLWHTTQATNPSISLLSIAKRVVSPPAVRSSSLYNLLAN